MTSGWSTPVHLAEDSSFPTIRIQNIVPEIAIMPQSEKHERQCLGCRFYKIVPSLYSGKARFI